jgi:hypothetical protein
MLLEAWENRSSIDCAMAGIAAVAGPSGGHARQGGSVPAGEGARPGSGARSECPHVARLAAADRPANRKPRPGRGHLSAAPARLLGLAGPHCRTGTGPSHRQNDRLRWGQTVLAVHRVEYGLAVDFPRGATVRAQVERAAAG